SNPLNNWYVGSPIQIPNDGQHQVFFDYKSLGVWQYADTVAMKALNANGGTFKVGQPRVADINGDGKINADDRIILGTTYPAWSGSVSNRISYGGFDMSGLVTIKWHYMIPDGTPRGMGGRNGNLDQDYWTPTNPTNANPSPQSPNSGSSWPYQSSMYYADGSNWRIRNITLGYTAGSRLAGRIGASSVRIYGTAQDPYVHTSYAGTDPEVGGAAPTIRTLLIGTNIVW
ncbi:MAG: hypothetical protein ABI664_16305, partial [bacterium]